MNPMSIEPSILHREREERLRIAGLLPQRTRRSSLEVLSDIRRDRRRFAG